MSDQRVEQTWETPSSEEIIAISKGHVAAMEASDADEVWRVAGMHHVVLETVGRRTGQVHKVALPIWRDPDGHRIVVASMAGQDRHPAWFLNIRDRKELEVLVRAQDKQFWSVPEVVEGDEHDRLWKLLVEDRAWYADYQAKTSRRIPLVRIPETRSA